MTAAASPVLAREIQKRAGRLDASEVERCTLLELVEAVSEVTSDDIEVVATVVEMLRSGSVCLMGTFHNEPISDFASAAED